MQEIWKDIEGYEGLYQISNLGNVKSLNFGRTKTEKLLSIGKTGKGYCAVPLCRNGEQKTVLVHRLVANAFIPNPQKLPQINHKNEIKTDNSVENLEWCDCKYNNNYGGRNAKAALGIGKSVMCIETKKDISKCIGGNKTKSKYLLHINKGLLPWKPKNSGLLSLEICRGLIPLLFLLFGFFFFSL